MSAWKSNMRRLLTRSIQSGISICIYMGHLSLLEATENSWHKKQNIWVPLLAVDGALTNWKPFIQLCPSLVLDHQQCWVPFYYGIDHPFVFFQTSMHLCILSTWWNSTSTFWRRMCRCILGDLGTTDHKVGMVNQRSIISILSKSTNWEIRSFA